MRSQASDGSRPVSRAALPSSDARLSDRHDAFPKSPARSYDVGAMEHLLKPLVVVKTHPASLSVKPRSLQPLMLLPRRHLQLSFLDLTSPSGTFEHSRYYEAQIKILDLEARLGAEPKVLIARLDYDKTIYALERQANGLCTLCKLKSDIELDVLIQRSTVTCNSAIRKRKAINVEDASSQPTTTLASHHETKKRRLAIEAIQSLVKKPARSNSDLGISPAAENPQSIEGDPSQDQTQLTQPDTLPGLSAHPGPTTAEARTNDVPQVDDISHSQSEEQNIFDGIRRQYQEALYHSMGSLAYFAKGPLSRARAAFHLDVDAKLEMADLVDFLKSLVMTTVQIDKKYRDLVPAMIKTFKNVLHDSEVENAAKVKKRKTKKIKLSKDGMYPNEEEYVSQWWKLRQPRLKDDESAPVMNVQWETSRLRSRETQLQMIIILEIMALEPLCSAVDTNNSQDCSLPGDESQLVDTVSQPAKKKRNRHNLPFLLDVHADRLTIWHSTAMDEFNIANDTSDQTGADSQNSAAPTADPLKDFCVDIIVPFFSARLPERCDTINRKLGGPIMTQSSKSRTKSHKTERVPTKAGAKVDFGSKRRTSGQKPTLENALSNEFLQHRRSMSRGPGGVIALMRSVSTPTLPALKREASEPAPMEGLPTTEDEDRDNSPELPPMQAPKRRLGEDRAKKDARVQAELKTAISALRKPNREVVGKAMEEAAERRATTTLSQLKKSRKPQLHSSRTHSVVKATPATSRFKDVLGRDAMSQPNFAAITEASPMYQAPSSASMIPSSAQRGRRPLGQDDNGFDLPNSRSRREQVSATPMKTTTARSTYLAPPMNDDGCLLASSPVMSRKIAQPRFVSAGHKPAALIHKDSGIELPSSPGISRLFATPVKRATQLPSMENFLTITPAPVRRTTTSSNFLKRDSNGAQRATPTKGKTPSPRKPSPGAEKATSIYARLGWDDEDDDDLC